MKDEDKVYKVREESKVSTSRLVKNILKELRLFLKLNLRNQFNITIVKEVLSSSIIEKEEIKKYLRSITSSSKGNKIL